MKKAIYLLVIISLLCSIFLVVDRQPAQADTEAPTDVPTSLVSSGVTSYALAAPKLFWHTAVPPCPPTSAGNDSLQLASPETIKRIATYGSQIRTLYEELRNCSEGQIPSSIVADGEYVYWLSTGGLMRLSTDANPGDPAELVNALLLYPGELAIAQDRIYAIYTEPGRAATKRVGYVWKDNKQLVALTTPGDATDLQSDGEYVYYRVAGSLIRLNPGVDNGITISSGVTGYYPEGKKLSYCTINPFQCYYSRNVYVAKGRYIYRYSNNDNPPTATLVYTSPDTTAYIYDMVSVSTGLLSTDLFFFERRTVTCPDLFCPYTTVVNRLRNSVIQPLYTYGPVLFDQLHNLNTDGTYLFWEEAGMLRRLSNDAAALPQVNMWITGMEVTQAVQDTSNSVLLVKNKRTFVRLYVKSEGTAVSGVTARLTSRVAPSDSLLPVNSSGPTITVRANPVRNDLNQSFLFELPWSWTQQDSVAINADLNPYKVPLEPNYGDNTWSTTVNFSPSPSLSVEFFRLNYNLNNTTYRPRIVQDMLKTYSWIMRAYPIGGAIGDKFKPRLWDVDGGTALGGYVNRTNPACLWIYPNPDDRTLCASYITNGWLFYYRIATMFGQLNVGLKTNAFYYGMISDASNNFPRGQAMYDKTSVGPAGIPGQFFNLGQGWDTDGSYADWYAAHEIGHSLGRAHPNAGSDNPSTSAVENCGHSRSDPSYPYGNTSTAAAPIGPGSGILEGFDVGDPSFGIDRQVYPSSTWNDVMSYCVREWISDYTYEGMYNSMIAHPSLLEQSASIQSVNGDFLAVAGMIDPGANSAGFSFIRRLADVVNAPPLVPGSYSLRLLNASDAQLASYSFTPLDYGDTGFLTFGQVVNFLPGTRKVQLLNANNDVLATQLVSANPPVVSNVALIGAPTPVSGVVTLGWTASDPDGDSLVFDIAYSRDNGATFQPVKFSITGNNTQVDTELLGGSGTAILRVTASDGVNSAYANSAPFVMSNKPPQPYILTPANNTQVHYGQLVNFNGLALDVQDGLVAASGLAWKDAGDNVLGTGPTLSTSNLPVGANVITLQATNSVGQTANATVTVIVIDDLNLPGPTLTVGPTQVGWQVSVGDSSLQSSQVAIGNAGSGSMDWNANESSGWLSLSASAGTVLEDGDPSNLMLFADPTGLAPGVTYADSLTITKPASGDSPEQTITIPVTLSIGDVWNVFQSKSVFLPLVAR